MALSTERLGLTPAAVVYRGPPAVRPPGDVVTTMPGRATAEKVARTLGLSRSTVAIVLRGDAVRRRVPECTTQRVLAAVREHHYVPNKATCLLRQQRTDRTGVLLPDFRKRRGVRVSDGLAVIGMRDVPLAGHSAIGLSTTREPLAEMGRGAAGAALRLIAGPSGPPPRCGLACDEPHARRTTLGDHGDP